jgi:uroporphyrinogen-III synthase
VFCVGDGTAEAARAAGFGRVVSAAGDLDDLVRLIVAERATLEGVVLRPGAARPAGDFVGRLAREGVPGRSAVVYATSPAPLRGELLRIWRRPDDLAATLLYSRRAAQRLADLCISLRPPPGVAICISQAAAEPLRGLGFARCVAAARPTEAAMIACVVELRSVSAPSARGIVG